MVLQPMMAAETLSPGSTLAASTGTAIPTVAFSVVGGTTTYRSWELASGSTLPAGVTFGSATTRLSTAGTVDTTTPTLTGTPTTAGVFTLRLIAYELTGRGGLSSPTFTYTITVGSTTSGAPTITVQPKSQSAVPGQMVTFTVEAAGATTYQWRKNGINVIGATGPTLTLTTVSFGDNGSSYTVVVGNTTASTATSAAAILTVTLVAPTITTQPLSQTVGAGATVTLSVTATGALTYQWRKNGVNIDGAVNPVLTLTNVTVNDSGAYTVRVGNTSGTVDSAVAQLQVNGVAAPSFTTQPQSVTVVTGSTVAFTVSATGVATYQWRKDGSNILGATNSTLVLTNVGLGDVGAYSVVGTNTTGNSLTSSSAVLSIAPGGTLDSKLTNLSIRTVLDLNQSLTVGFVTNGNKSVLVRGAGPGLVLFGIPNYLPDPALKLFDSTGKVVAQNDSWDLGLTPTFTRVGAFAFAIPSLDAALLQTVNGQATALATGTSIGGAPGAGTILVEVYDADLDTAPSRLINVSARNQVGLDDNIMISGFVIGPRGGPAKTVLIRGIGPALKDVFGVAGALVDPKLELYDANNAKLAENDNWSPNLAPYFTAVGAYAFSANSKDAALMITLPSGAYTVQLSGVDRTVGDGVIEVYVVP